MATYLIRASHEVMEYAELEIEADSLEEAMEKAKTPEELSYAYWQLSDVVGDTEFECIESYEDGEYQND